MTKVSERGKLFNVDVFGIKEGDIIILALYDGDRLLQVQHAPYEGSSLTFETQKVYENAKVMVWDGETKMKPSAPWEKIYVY